MYHISFCYVLILIPFPHPDSQFCIVTIPLLETETVINSPYNLIYVIVFKFHYDAPIPVVSCLLCRMFIRR